jgi:hypothetical protein
VIEATFGSTVRVFEFVTLAPPNVGTPPDGQVVQVTVNVLVVVLAGDNVSVRVVFDPYFKGPSAETEMPVVCPKASCCTGKKKIIAHKNPRRL